MLFRPARSRVYTYWLRFWCWSWWSRPSGRVWPSTGRRTRPLGWVWTRCTGRLWATRKRCTGAGDGATRRWSGRRTVCPPDPPTDRRPPATRCSSWCAGGVDVLGGRPRSPARCRWSPRRPPGPRERRTARSALRWPRSSHGNDGRLRRQRFAVAAVATATIRLRRRRRWCEGVRRVRFHNAKPWLTSAATAWRRAGGVSGFPHTSLAPTIAIIIQYCFTHRL